MKISNTTRPNRFALARTLFFYSPLATLHSPLMQGAVLLLLPAAELMVYTFTAILLFSGLEITMTAESGLAVILRGRAAVNTVFH